MRELKVEMEEYYKKIMNNKEEDVEEDIEIKEEKQFNIINNYSHCIEEFISLFDKKDLQNEAVLSTIFDYLRKLFDSYKMALKIRSQVNKEFQKKLSDKIIDYFSKFFEYKIFWLLDLLEILKETQIKFFFELAVVLMRLFLIKGQLYQTDSNSENFNKFYAKQYFKAALDICEKYKLDKLKDNIEREQQKSYEDIKNQCLAKINILDSEYLIAIQNIINSKKLISNDLINNKENLYLISDAFHQNIIKLDGFDDNDSLKISAFCYANIIKIEFKLFENFKNLGLLKHYCEKCNEKYNNFNKTVSWFK